LIEFYSKKDQSKILNSWTNISSYATALASFTA